MQKLISKYGLAAHLALLAVAPLFLSPVCVLWLSLIGAIWLVMAPSRIGDEYLHEARRRVIREIYTDPFFWLSLLVVAYAAIRCGNGGITLRYDAEMTKWMIVGPGMELLPGSVDGFGFSEFALTIALMVVLQGCRHAMGLSARMSFCVMATLFAGYGALVLAVALGTGSPDVLALAACNTVRPAYLGSAFGVYLSLGVIALLAVFERKWFLMVLPMMLAIGGCMAGLFLFAPVFAQMMFGAALALTLAYAFFYARRTMSHAGEFRYLVVFFLSVVIGGIVVLLTFSERDLQARLAEWTAGTLLGSETSELRATLDSLSFSIWKSAPWLGKGLGSFPLALKFCATDSDWMLIPPEQMAPLNGYWQLLTERGIVGAVFVACPLAFLLWTYGRRAAKGLLVRLPHPLCWVGPLSLFAALAEMAFDVSYALPGVMLAVAATVSLSAGSFPKEK